jgi:hypothetical protein
MQIPEDPDSTESGIFCFIRKLEEDPVICNSHKDSGGLYTTPSNFSLEKLKIIVDPTYFLITSTLPLEDVTITENCDLYS